MRARARRSIILTGGAVAAATGVVSPAAHATVDAVEVTNLNDSGPGSLRDAIGFADGDPDLTTITFASGLTGTITLTSGPLAPLYAVSIQGPGAALLSVDGGGQSTVFYFYGSYGGTSTISGLTISGGAPSVDLGPPVGSGILGIRSHLTLDAVIVEENTAFSGGGVLLSGVDTQFLAVGSTIRNNTLLPDDDHVVFPHGGAGLAFGVLPGQQPGVEHANHVREGDASVQAPPSSQVTLVDSTISGNTGSGYGGGVMFLGYGSANLSVDHSTVSGNTASAGGGIYVGRGFFSGTDEATIVDSTISGNSALGDADDYTSGLGGGILAVGFVYPTLTLAPGSEVPSARAHLSAARSSRGAAAADSAAALPDSVDLVIENTTVTGNSSLVDGGGVVTATYSCGCYGLNEIDPTIANSIGGTGVNATISNTIIGGNIAPTDPDASNVNVQLPASTLYFGTFAADYSVIGAVDPDGTQVAGTGLVIGDPLLGPLADNGGPTSTHLPLAGSPAIDAGDPAFVAPPADDQRHGSRVVNGALDIGAVEVVPGPLDDSYSTPEDVPLVIAANGVLGNDPDAVNLSAAVATGPSHGTLALSGDGSFTYTPNANYNGPDSFTYTTTGLFGVTGTATVTIAVTPVNDPPVAVDDTSAAVQGGPAVGINVLANDSDPDGDTLSVTGTSGGAGSATLVAGRSPAHGLVSFTPTSVVYTPTATFVGTDTFTYTITDGALTATATVTVTVNAAEIAAAPPATAAPTMPPPVELPSTGQPADNSLELATATLGTGLALTLIGRRRRKSLRKA